MISRQRQRAFAVLGTLALILLVSFERFRYQDPFSRVLSPTEADLDELCQIDAEDSWCHAHHKQTTARESSHAPVDSDADAPVPPGPAKIIYPPGYEKLGLKDPLAPEAASVASDAPREPVNLTRAGVTETLEAWIPYVARKDMNKVLFQTWHADPGPLSVPFSSWRDKHRGQDSFSRFFVDDDGALQLMLRLARDLPLLKETYDRLAEKILQFDFLRYAALFKDGGVYADFDTQCYKPIERWLELCRSGADGERTPGFLVGIDLDLDGDANFDAVDGHALLLADYVWAARRGHPILRDLLADIIVSSVEDRGRPAKSSLREVRLRTGRVRFTELILRHIQRSIKGFSAQSLHGLQQPKVFADVCVLPIAAFGSGQRKYSNSPESEQDNPAILVKHYFMESWVKRTPAT